MCDIQKEQKKCKWHEYGCHKLFSADNPLTKYNHERVGSTAFILVQSLIQCCVECKYRPKIDFIEHLKLPMFKSKFPESNFVARMDALSTSSSKLIPFTEVEWSTNLWQEHGRLDNIPFIVRNYPDMWKGGECPTEGQFIKCSYQIDAHPDGMVFTAFFVDLC